VGQVLGAQVALRLDNAALQARLGARSLLQHYVAGIDESDSLFCTDGIHGQRLLELFCADGLISHINGVVMTHGYTVELPALLPLVGQLQQLAVAGISCSHWLSTLDQSAASFASQVSGALLIELTGESGDYILLLRREMVETVSWAGNPDKSVNTDALGRLRPRTSFAVWHQTVRNRSRRWTELELETARSLRLELLRLRGAFEASQSNKRFRFLADSMPLLIWTATPNGKFDYYNERWLSYSSVPPDRLKNWNWQEAIHPDDFPICLDRWKKTVSTHCDYKMECRLKHGSSGDYRWTLAQAFPLRNNKSEVIQWIGTCTDIEDQKQARKLLERAVQERTAELAKARAQLQTVLDGATKVSIVATDTEGIITVFNAGAENMLGYTSQEMVGKQTPALFHVESELLARGLALEQETGKTISGFDVFAERPRKGLHEQREWTYVRKDRQRLTVSLVVTALRDAAGTIIGFLGVAMDMTELKKAEAAARASNEHFRLIIETIEDYALIMLDARGHIVSWNVGAERITGYQASEIIGHHFSGFHPRKEIERKHPDSVLQLAATHGRYAEEGWRIRKGGSGYWADVAISAMYDQGGHVRGFAKVIHDITKRKKFEEKLREQALILDAANDAIVIRDIDDRITYWNQGAQRLYGWGRDEAMGQVGHTLLKAHFPQPLDSITEQLFSEGRWQGEAVHTKRDGSVITVASTWTLQHNDANLLASVLEMNYDITARKRAEEQLRVVGRRLELAKDSLRAGVWDWDIQTNVLVWDDRIYEIYDLPKGTPVTYQYWKGLVFAEDLAAAEAALQQITVSKSQGSLEFRIKLPDGVVRHVYCALGTILDDGGKVVRVVGVHIDITERKRADAALLEASNLLKLRVAELDAANKELGKKNEEVEAFVYIVSHDLRSPLVNLQGFCTELELSCEELRQKLTAADQAVQTILTVDIPESLRHIGASATKFHRLINSLLQLSRYGRQDYHPEELDLGALTRSTLDLLSLSIASGGVEVQVGSLPKVYGDATALGQVFANLVGNAVKYMKPGRPGRIEIGGEAHAGTAHCWVKDNGAGFPVSAKPRLFQVFQRFHPNLAEGEGMGLAIVRRVVERHGGAIWAESEENVGTTFHFTLPCGRGLGE
jgi:PAS domain S-box-containing protein